MSEAMTRSWKCQGCGFEGSDDPGLHACGSPALSARLVAVAAAKEEVVEAAIRWGTDDDSIDGTPETELDAAVARLLALKGATGE